MGQPVEPWLMRMNAGAGPGYNVSGALYWRSGIGGGWQIIPTSIPAGRQLPSMMDVHPRYEVTWAEAVGYLRYFV